MAHYALHGSTHGPTPSSHRYLLGPPLVLIGLFCFAFLQMQPHHSVGARSLSATKQTTAPTSTAPLTNVSSPGQQPPVSSLTTPPPSGPAPSVTPQSSASSTGSQSAGNAAGSLQAAVPNNQTKAGESKNANLNSPAADVTPKLVKVALPAAEHLLKTLTGLR